jgi:hypothetical protein
MSMLIRRDENNLDKLFRQKLYDAEEATPLHLWEGIRQKSSRKKRGFYWFSAIAAGLLLSIGVWYFSKQETTTLANQEISVPQNDSSTTKESASNNVQRESETTDKTTQQELSETKKPISNAASGLVEHDGSASTNHGAKSKTETKLDKIKNSEAPNAADKQNIHAATNTKNESSKKSITDLNKSDVKSIASAKPIIGSQLIENQVQPSIFKPGSNANLEEEKPESQTPSSTIPLAKLEDELLNDEPAPMSITDAVLQNNSLNTLPWQIGLYGLLTTPYHSESKGHNPEQIEALLSRTKTHPGAGVGLGISYRILPTISIGAGLELYSFKEDHSWHDTTGYAGYFEEVSYETYYPNPDSSPVLIMVVDTIYNEEVSTVSKRTTNVYSSINVPILIGIHRQHRKLTYGLEFGPVIRLQRGYQGSFVFPGADLVPFNQNTSSPDLLENYSQLQVLSRPDVSVSLQDYYTRWRTDIHVGLQLGYQLKPNLSLGLGLFYRQSVRVIDKGSALAHRMVQPGLRFGVNYHF